MLLVELPGKIILLIFTITGCYIMASKRDTGGRRPSADTALGGRHNSDAEDILQLDPDERDILNRCPSESILNSDDETKDRGTDDTRSTIASDSSSGSSSSSDSDSDNKSATDKLVEKK